MKRGKYLPTTIWGWVRPEVKLLIEEDVIEEMRRLGDTQAICREEFVAQLIEAHYADRLASS